MKSLTTKQLLLLFLSLFYLSCEEQNIGLKTPNKVDLYEVKNGMLVFNDKLAFQETILEFNQYSLEDLQKWEQKTEGFKSLRSSFSDVDSVGQLPISISTVLNEHGLFQIGDTIVLINNNVEYLIPNGDVEVLQQIQNSISNKIEIEEERFVKRTIKAQSIPLAEEEKQSQNNALNWLDGRYQKEFYAPKAKHTYKFIYEVHVYDYYYFIQLEVRSKFQYKKKRFLGGNTWEPAGNIQEKIISNLVIQGSLNTPWNPTFYINEPYIYQQDNKDLAILVALAADAIYDLQVSGHFSSKAMHPALDYETYIVSNAYWYKSYLSK